jgi:Bacteriocin-protection, YdeI or OmpD-Associated/Domain of unknown function (DUF1905)
MRYRGVIEGAGKTAAGIEVPVQVLESLGAGKRPPVRVTINGHVYRTSVGSMGGRYLVSCSTENRQAAGVAIGQKVDVAIEVDAQPREVVLPEDFMKELKRETAAHRFFNGLSYSERRWFVLGIEGAKTAETRQRRIVKAVDRLRSGRGQR